MPHDETAKLALWDAFCRAHQVLERSVPLFDRAPDGSIAVDAFGRDGRPVLRRSLEMQEVVVREVERVLADFNASRDELDGLLYMMLRSEEGRAVPLYIGRAGKYGRGAGNLSANLAGIRTNVGKFARWGSNYAYHIGDLSAVVCPGHPPTKANPKYRRWAQRLFESIPSARPRLQAEVRFWCVAWGAGSQSIWREYGASSLSFQEYLLIGVASDLFPDSLLNDEGVNRAGAAETIALVTTDDAAAHRR